MRKKTVAFIAFLEQDNLGVGYMASLLLSKEIDFKIIDFRVGKEKILDELLQIKPLVAGFSVIFQYHIYKFRDLIRYLRENGVDCHFTAGGHYPSLRCREFLGTIPEFDSVVLYEGEFTLLELVKALQIKGNWKNIDGIAYQGDGAVICNPLRPLEEDLDAFPLPVRQPLREYALGKKYATILAGRGCYYNCTFCSIREFYVQPPGPIKRVRRPEMVVREMELLHQQLDCSVFMFQDDDFPVMGAKGKKWATDFCKHLAAKGLDKKVMWKINCRSDEVESELFSLMKAHGLFLVYLGIENGTDAGLKLMNKKITPQRNIEAVNTLKELGIKYDYGFMLFDPGSTFQSVYENLNFLEEICGDGSSPVTFCKMLPYSETEIEKQLKKEGRLKGNVECRDYDFFDPALDYLYAFMSNCFEKWIAKHDGLLNFARWTRNHASVYEKYFTESTAFRELEQAIAETVSESNSYFIDTAKELAQMFETQRCLDGDLRSFYSLRIEINKSHERYKQELTELMGRMERMADLRQLIPATAR